MFELVDSAPQSAVIKVIGVGGGGGNAVQHMLQSNVEGVDFIAANTDAQALKNIHAKTVLQMGSAITKGLGAGANPDVGRQAALEDRDRIGEALAGADMVFITAGMGGGTGTGAAPVVAEVARELGILTVAVVTRPFRFEKRGEAADRGIRELSAAVDSLITIPNEKLLAVLGEKCSMLDAFREANEVLQGAVQGIADLIIRPGMMNVDFADVRTVMSEMGMAMMGTGRANGDSRARDAAERAIRSPLLEDVDLNGARGILVNVTAGPDLSIGEFTEVGEVIDGLASESATVVVGTVIDPDIGDELKVTVVATGLGEPQAKEAPIAIVKPISTAPRPMANTTEQDLPPGDAIVTNGPGSEPAGLGRTGTDGYERYDEPTWRRDQESRETPQEPEVTLAMPQEAPQEKERKSEFLDIPTFIRSTITDATR